VLEPQLQSILLCLFWRWGISWIVCLGWPWTVILLISVSQGARIIGESHQHPASFQFLILHGYLYIIWNDLTSVFLESPFLNSSDLILTFLLLPLLFFLIFF
jgi:hypothetical protein